MFDATTSLFPKPTGKSRLKAMTIVFDETSGEEMTGLLKTLEIDQKNIVSIELRKISAGTYLGSGKLLEIKGSVERFDLVIVDAECSPQQLRNIEKILGVPVFDRAGVIIEIFWKNAKTKEAKVQVELAKLQYLMPRLAHYWSHFERQRGGSVGLRGMGEKQVEVDRRLIKKRIQILRGRLKEIEIERTNRRQSRKDVLKVAFVGYTNAGKSTLLNQMTRSNVLAEDKLFATLDASVRMLNPDSHPPVVAIDTVGFIHRIPPSLVASFKSTLEELHEADLLVHVVDLSHRYFQEQWKVTQAVLKDLKLDEKPTLCVFNQLDQIKENRPIRLAEAKILERGAVFMSALDPRDVEGLRKRVMDFFKNDLEVWEVVLPYAESRLDAMIHAYGIIEKTNFLDHGIFYRLKIETEWARKLDLKRFRI